MEHEPILTTMKKLILNYIAYNLSCIHSCYEILIRGQRGISKTVWIETKDFVFEIKYWRSPSSSMEGMKNESHETYEIPERKASKFLRRINIFTVHSSLTLYKKKKIEGGLSSCFAPSEQRCIQTLL